MDDDGTIGSYVPAAAGPTSPIESRDLEHLKCQTHWAMGQRSPKHGAASNPMTNSRQLPETETMGWAIDMIEPTEQQKKLANSVVQFCQHLPI